MQVAALIFQPALSESEVAFRPGGRQGSEPACWPTITRPPPFMVWKATSEARLGVDPGA